MIRTNDFLRSSSMHIGVQGLELKSPSAFVSSVGQIQEVVGPLVVDHPQLLLVQIALNPSLLLLLVKCGCRRGGHSLLHHWIELTWF